ncbi:LuxR family transcriptional regulator [Bradyrhizobium canariense]|nr:LuxR family transcriptional regulator [Bradyrhizobium canariense]
MWMKHYPSREFDAFRSAAEGMVGALAAAKDLSEIDRIFVERITTLGFHTAGYIRVFGQGQFHSAEFLFGGTVPNWAERYQAQYYRIDDPVVSAACRMTGAFTLDEVAGTSRLGAPILKDSRRYGLYDGFCAPIRAEYDEMGLVMLGTGRLLHLGDYERFLLQGMCEAYAQAGLKMHLAPHAAPPSLTRRETECLRWVAIGRSDPQIGMILGLSPNTVHAHVEAAKCKLGANSRAQLVLRAVMAGILRSDPSQQ